MNLTLSIDEDTFVRARNKAGLLGKSLNQLILDYLQDLASIDNRGQSIEEFRRLSGQGNSRGWHFDAMKSTSGRSFFDYESIQ